MFDIDFEVVASDFLWSFVLAQHMAKMFLERPKAHKRERKLVMSAEDVCLKTKMIGNGLD